jgi:tetratricopeptide (TPR) repeat protein
MKKFLFFSIFLLATSAASAQFYSYFEGQEFNKAIAVSGKEMNIQLQRFAFLSSEIANLHTDIAQCYIEVKKIEKAIEHLSISITINDYLNGDSTLFSAYQNELIAQLYLNNNNYLDAACHYERCFIVNRKHKGETSLSCIDNLNIAAICYDKANKLELAERNYIIAERLLNENPSGNERMLRIVRQSLKHLYRTTKAYEKEKQIDVKLGLSSGLETTNKINPTGEKCDCVNHLVPAEELLKLGITPK